jgi:hypothetical protein
MEKRKRAYVSSDEIKLFRMRIGEHLAVVRGDPRQPEDATDAMIRRNLELHGA